MDKKIIVALLAVIMLGMGAVTYWHMSSAEKAMNSAPPRPGREHRPTQATDDQTPPTQPQVTAPGTADSAGNTGGAGGEQASGQGSENAAPVESALTGKPKQAPRELTAEQTDSQTGAQTGGQTGGQTGVTTQTQSKPTETEAEKATEKQAVKQPEKTAPKPPMAKKPEPAQKTPEKAPANMQDNANPNGTLAIRNISLQFSGKGMVLRIVAESAITVKTFTLPSPDRLVVDVPGKWKNFTGPSIPSNNLVSGARVGRNGNVDRLVLDLKSPLKKQNVVKINNSTYEVHFE